MAANSTGVALTLVQKSDDPNFQHLSSKVFMATPGNPPTVLDFSGKVAPLEFSPDGQKLLITAWHFGSPSMVYLYSISGTLLWQKEVMDGFSVRFAGDGQNLIGVIPDKSDPNSRYVEVWGMDGSPKKRFDLVTPASFVRFFGGPSKLLLLRGNQLTSVSPESMETIWQVNLPTSPG